MPSRSSKKGLSTVVGTIIALGVILITTLSIISLQVSYQNTVIQSNQLAQDRKAENFVLDGSFANGTGVHVTNRGTIQIRIVALYINHACRWSESPLGGCRVQVGVIIDPESSQWISTGVGGLSTNSRVEVTSARGNQAAAILPVAPVSSGGAAVYLYYGVGPLSITLVNGSFTPFTYSYWDSSVNLPVIQTSAWNGIPINNKYTNPLFTIGIINHAQGDITLLQQSVLFVTPTCCTGGSGGGIRGFYLIVDSQSSVNGKSQTSGLVAYDQISRPYIIHQNATDQATGGPPVMVSFAATSAGTNLQAGPINIGSNQLPQTVAVFLGLIYVWNGQQFSENIPFATLRLCTATDPTCAG